MALSAAPAQATKNRYIYFSTHYIGTIKRLWGEISWIWPKKKLLLLDYNWWLNLQLLCSKLPHTSIYNDDICFPCHFCPMQIKHTVRRLFEVGLWETPDSCRRWQICGVRELRSCLPDWRASPSWWGLPDLTWKGHAKSGVWLQVCTFQPRYALWHLPRKNHTSLPTVRAVLIL